MDGCGFGCFYGNILGLPDGNALCMSYWCLEEFVLRNLVSISDSCMIWGLCFLPIGARCSSVARPLANGAMCRGWSLYGGPIELFIVPASAPRLV